jgi:hypothetical protein
LKKLEFLGFLPVNPGYDEEPKRRTVSMTLHVASWVPEEDRRKLEEVTRRINERLSNGDTSDGY